MLSEKTSLIIAEELRDKFVKIPKDGHQAARYEAKVK